LKLLPLRETSRDVQKMSTTTTSSIKLKGPKDWDDWKQSFEGHATQLWPIITGKRVPMQYDPYPAIEAQFPHVLQPGEVVGQIGNSTLYCRLTDAQRISYDAVKKNWSSDNHLYTEEQKGLQKIRDWMTDTIAPEVYARCCPGGQELDTWWTNLQAAFASSAEELNTDVNRLYRTALTPMKRGQFEPWLKRWEDARAKIDARRIPELQNPAIWLSELSDAVAGVLPIWAENTDKYLTELVQGTKTWIHIAGYMRTHYNRHNSKDSGHGQHPQAGFPSTYDDQDADGNTRGRVEGRGKKRPRSESSRKACHICGKIGHQARNCWYGPASSEAPESWKPNAATKRCAEANLKNSAIKGEAKRATKRTRRDEIKGEAHEEATGASPSN